MNPRLTVPYLALLALLIAACSSQPVTSPSPSPIAVSVAPAPSPSPVADSCFVAGITYCWLNPNVTQATIQATICVAGWTSTVRPPTSYTSPLKLKQIAAEGLSDTDPTHYEEDHRVPLELGGAPADPRNLSPESHEWSSVKDVDENGYRTLVCTGVKTLRQAQADFIGRWLGPYPTYR